MSKFANAKDKHLTDVEFQALKETIGRAQRSSNRKMNQTMTARRRSLTSATTEFK